MDLYGCWETCWRMSIYTGEDTKASHQPKVICSSWGQQDPLPPWPPRRKSSHHAVWEVLSSPLSFASRTWWRPYRWRETMTRSTFYSPLYTNPYVYSPLYLKPGLSEIFGGSILCEGWFVILHKSSRRFLQGGGNRVYLRQLICLFYRAPVSQSRSAL